MVAERVAVRPLTGSQGIERHATACENRGVVAKVLAQLARRTVPTSCGRSPAIAC
jgi:hypothetical protein